MTEMTKFVPVQCLEELLAAHASGVLYYAEGLIPPFVWLLTDENSPQNRKWITGVWERNRCGEGHYRRCDFAIAVEDNDDEDIDNE